MRADILVLDGRHLLWRTSDAFRDLTAEVGGKEIGTGGMYGFLSVGLKIHNRWGGMVMVAWEAPDRKSNFRFELYPEYKAKKQELDDDTLEMIRDMNIQETRLKVMLRYMGVRQYCAVGGEADDVIGRLSVTFPSKQVILYSGDSDLRQLVRPGVACVSPGWKGKETVYEVEDDVQNKHGVPPRLLADLKAIAGDGSDNIPGIRGIGDVTGAALCLALGDIEDIIERAKSDSDDWPVADRHRPPIVAQAEDIRMYKKLTTIQTDGGMYAIAPARDKKALIRHLMAYKFRSLTSPLELTGLMKMATG